MGKTVVVAAAERPGLAPNQTRLVLEFPRGQHALGVKEQRHRHPQVQMRPRRVRELRYREFADVFDAHHGVVIHRSSTRPGVIELPRRIRVKTPKPLSLLDKLGQVINHATLTDMFGALAPLVFDRVGVAVVRGKQVSLIVSTSGHLIGLWLLSARASGRRDERS